MAFTTAHSYQMSLQNIVLGQVQAAKIGDLQSLKNHNARLIALLQDDDPKQHTHLSQEALTQACKAGHLQCVQFLIAYADISYGQHVAVRCAIQSNHPDCLRLLMEHTQLPLPIYQFCLEETAKHNQPQCLKILVDHFQDNADYNTVLMTSAIREHHECVDILYPIGDPKHALMRIQTYHDEEMGSYLAAKLQQERLNVAVGEAASLKIYKKM